MHFHPPEYFRFTFDPDHFVIDPRHSAEGQHALNSRYVDLFWMPILGPTATTLLRRLGEIHNDTCPATGGPHTVAVPVGDLTFAIGIGNGTSPNSIFGRSIERLEHRRMLTKQSPDQWHVSTHIGGLLPRHTDKLPESLRTLHAIETSQA